MSRARTTLRFLGALAAVAAGTAVIGNASGLAVSTAELGVGSAPVQGCLSSIPTSENTLSVVLSDKNNGNDPQSITTVTVGGFPAACIAATLSASLTNAANTQNPAPTTGQGSCTLTGGTGTCSLSPPVPLSSGSGKNQTNDYPLTLSLAVANGAGTSGAGSLSVSASGLVAGACPPITKVIKGGSTPGYC
jgi:hypothetical protein